MTRASLFSDESRAPTAASIRAALGRAMPAWSALFDRLHAEHPELQQTWRYYVDGKSWLLKLSRGSRTMCWISVGEGAFRVAFYFARRLTPALLESDLSEERKAEIGRDPPGGKLRAVAVTFGPARGVRDVLALLELKQRLA